MSFFNQSEQQRLMAQMFGGGANGMPPFQTPQGQGGVGQNAPQIGPSFVAPGDAATGGMGSAMPNDLGVEAPDNFSLPVPNIGDQGMVRTPPNGFNDNMPTEIPPGYAGDMGANNVAAGADQFATSLGLGEGAKRRLIDAIMARGVI